MTDPCKRHKIDKSVDPDWKPVCDAKETQWAIAVIPRCMKCGEYLRPRVVMHTIKPTQREAMHAFDAKLGAEFDAAWPPEPTPAPKPLKRIERPLTSWPFKTSAHVERA